MSCWFQYYQLLQPFCCKRHTIHKAPLFRKGLRKERIYKVQETQQKSICITVTIFMSSNSTQERFYFAFKWIPVYQWYIITDKFFNNYLSVLLYKHLLYQTSSILPFAYRLWLCILHLSFKNSNSVLQSSYSLYWIWTFLAENFYRVTECLSAIKLIFSCKGPILIGFFRFRFLKDNVT